MQLIDINKFEKDQCENSVDLVFYKLYKERF